MTQQIAGMLWFAVLSHVFRRSNDLHLEGWADRQRDHVFLDCIAEANSCVEPLAYNIHQVIFNA
ncbi:hypothetical protein D3C75_763260 [compost metagenome]